MCEIAIMVHDVIADDPIADSKMFKRGDIIEVLEDGADWGDHALVNPRFRMIRLTGVSVVQAIKYLAREAHTDPEASSKVLRQRMHKLDVDVTKPHPKWSAFISDSARSTPLLVLSARQVKDLVAAITIKIPLSNP